MNNQTADKSKHSGHAEEHRQLTNTPTENSASATSADTHAHDNDRSHLDTRPTHPEQRTSHQVSGGSSNFNSTTRRHGHTGGQAKTRPLIRSTTSGTKLTSQGRRRRAKFVFGDQELEEEVHPDEERHLQQTQSVEGPSTNRVQLLQHERPGHPSGKRTPQENQDSGHGPNSETIPNVHQRNHPRRIEPLGAVGGSSADKAKTETNASEDSDSIGLIQPDGSALQQEQYPAYDKQFKQTHTSGHSKDQRTVQRVVSLPNCKDGPEKPISSASTSTTKHSCHISRSNTAPSAERQPDYPIQLEPSKRLSRLLHPSRSTTSLPSITRTISRPVLSTVSPSQSIGDSSDHRSEEGESATISALSATLKNEQLLISPVVDLVSKFLNPYTSMRSKSHSNLSTMASSLGTSSDMFGFNRHHHHQRQQQHPGSTGTSVFSPPRTNDSSTYLISRFLPNSPSQPLLVSPAPRLASSSMLTTSPTAITPPQPPPPQIKRRKVPASLQMTLAAYSPEGESSPQDQAVLPSSIPTTPSRPTTPVSISSVYSSAEGGPQHQSPDPGNSISSSWNPAESMSRTQQKLMLQKESSQDDMDEHEIVRRGKAMREMEKIQRDYRCVRICADPMLDSLARCKARQEMEQKLSQTQKDARMGADLKNYMTPMSVKSM